MLTQLMPEMTAAEAAIILRRILKRCTGHGNGVSMVPVQEPLREGQAIAVHLPSSLQGYNAKLFVPGTGELCST